MPTVFYSITNGKEEYSLVNVASNLYDITKLVYSTDTRQVGYILKLDVIYYADKTLGLPSPKYLCSQ